MCVEVAVYNTLLEHVTILNVHANPDLESVLLSQEFCECVLNGLALALEKFDEAVSVLVWCEALHQEGSPECSLCLPASEG